MFAILALSAERAIFVFNMEKNLQELLDKRENYRTRMFWILLEIAVIFGIPAFIGFWLQKWLSESGQTLIVSLLPLLLAFIISWVITVKRVKKVGGELASIEEEIKQKRNE